MVKSKEEIKEHNIKYRAKNLDKIKKQNKIKNII